MSVAGAYSRHHDTRASNYQVWSWFFMRISGLVLVFLVLGHMLIMHVLDGGVDRINYDFVAQRWTGWFWRTYDWLMLVLAMLHGAVGARNSIVDHIRKPRGQKVAKTILYGIVLVLLVLGTFVIVSFDPFQTPG
ncbi:MAG TPA: succinate dehydrogenase hydrophobic membrane anchor subunit [Actinomycetota bacterium]|nr:succinate dehydrogenase hydrophobic membrane anchor subunit [Actinomycetota bacterium]